MTITTQQINNYWKKVIKTDSCWIWTACTNVGGYGKFNINNQWFLAHRVSLMLSGLLPVEKKKDRGPKGQIVLHICDNTKCVNPEHLILSTQKENMQDAKSKGRKWAGEISGEKNGRATIDNKTVIAIKELLKIKKQNEVARTFNVSKYIISNIARGKTWTHV